MWLDVWNSKDCQWCVGQVMGVVDEGSQLIVCWQGSQCRSSVRIATSSCCLALLSTHTAPSSPKRKKVQRLSEHISPPVSQMIDSSAAPSTPESSPFDSFVAHPSPTLVPTRLLRGEVIAHVAKVCPNTVGRCNECTSTVNRVDLAHHRVDAGHQLRRVQQELSELKRLVQPLLSEPRHSAVAVQVHALAERTARSPALSFSLAAAGDEAEGEVWEDECKE